MKRTVLHMRFAIGTTADGFLAEAPAVAATLAATPGLLWKVWLRNDDAPELGGVYLFADRPSAEAYLASPTVLGVRHHPAVSSFEATLWDIDAALSAMTRGPLEPVTTKREASFEPQGEVR